MVVLAREGKPLAVDLSQAILDQTFYAVSKIARNKDGAMKFINFASQTKPHGAARPVPARSNQPQSVGSARRQDPAGHRQLRPPRCVLRNPECWADQETPMLEQWKKFLAA